MENYEHDEIDQEEPVIRLPEIMPEHSPAEPESSAPALEEPAPQEAPASEEEHTRFEVYHEPEPAPMPEKPEKKKSKGWMTTLVAILVVALVAQTALLAVSLSNSRSIAGTFINDNGELVVSYSDGSTQNLGVVVGKDGTNGTNGSNGTTTVITTSDTDPIAISNGLRSSVSIFCTFVQESRRGNTTNYYSAGSGVIYQLDKETGSAFIVTNYHVVYDPDSRQDNGIAETINVYLYGSEYNGMEMQATYVGGSMYYDLAVLYVQGSELLRQSDAVAVTIADSDLVQVGSTAIAIGNAESEGISVTSGVVSVASEYITMTAADGYTSVDYRVMRVDTAVNSGNSGGGLFNEDGQLIGIVNAKTVDDGVENIGYALPSAAVKAVVDNIIYYCFNTDCEDVMRPIMGITVLTIDSRAEYDGETGLLTIVETVEVQEVSSNQIGSVFMPGDILVSVSMNGTGKQLTRQYHVIDLMITARVGDVVEFTVLRDGVETKLQVTVTADCLTAY